MNCKIQVQLCWLRPDRKRIVAPRLAGSRAPYTQHMGVRPQANSPCYNAHTNPTPRGKYMNKSSRLKSELAIETRLSSRGGHWSGGGGWVMRGQAARLCRQAVEY